MEPGGVDANVPPQKRMRRPNVRLQQPYYDENPKRSKTHRLNSNNSQEQEISKGSNVDGLEIGDWRSFHVDRIVRKKRMNKKRAKQRELVEEEEGNYDNDIEIGDSNERLSEGLYAEGDEGLGFEKRVLERGGNSMEMNNDSGVRDWLSELGLAKYAPLFQFNEVDDDVLPLLTLEDLKDMGITAVGSRRKMYASIQKLRRGFS